MNTKAKKLIASLFVIAFGIGAAMADDAGVCRRAKDKQAGVRTQVFNSYAKIDTSTGFVHGLDNKFCLFNNGENYGAVDLQTLGSRNPSIAATYIIKGLDLVALGLPPKDTPNPGTWYCGKLKGTSITQVANGGFTTTKEGDVAEICVFGDGSKVGIWELIYISQDSSYLSIRKAVKSEPLALSLPFMGTGN